MSTNNQGEILFSNLIFLIILLFLINISPEFTTDVLPFSPFIRGLISLGIYAGLLSFIVLQNFLSKALNLFSKNTLSVLVNLELIVFFTVYYIILGGNNLFNSFFLTDLQFIPIVISLFFYFFALVIFHYSYSKIYYAPFPFANAIKQIRLILPFALPFLLFTILLDLIVNIPNQSIQNYLTNYSDTTLGTLLLFCGTLLLMGLLLAFLPPLIIRIWQCRPLSNTALKQRLEKLCEKASFKHGGMLEWSILNQSLTAAIVGVVPRLRYVLFTKRLEEELKPEAIEAILAHEIGHSQWHHLLIYPFIFFGMVVSLGIFSLLFSEATLTWFSIHSEQNPSPFWIILYPVVVFISFALFIWFYFRYVVGFFSRLFERQADLHGFSLGLPHQSMVQALDDVAIATGFTHMIPNWHHYSIQERIDFLQAAAKTPSMIQAHHRRVKRYLFFYFLLLAASSWMVFAPIFPNVSFFKQTNKEISRLSFKISKIINSP